MPDLRIANCGTDVPDEATLLAVQADIEQFDRSRTGVSGKPVIVPVYFHVISKGDVAEKGNVPDGALARQIEILNDAYARTPFRFEMAGVTRTTNPRWHAMTQGSDAEREAKSALHQGGPTALNFYIADLPSTVDGWASYAHRYAEESSVMDGVVVDYATLPGGAAFGYQLGEAAVHEVGHWLGFYDTPRQPGRVDAAYSKYRLRPASALSSVPDWFGAEDSGGGVALVDLNGNGQPELIASFVTNPAGADAGYYRIGFDVNSYGTVTGGWALKSVPGWFGHDNDGADIAVGDLNGNGRPELIFYQIDDAPGENHGYYRVGFDLDTFGNASSWSAVKLIPGWFGATNEGGGLALADLNGNSVPELIVFFVVNPAGENWGYYRIGWDMNSVGNPSSWGGQIQVPGWFGANNNDAGIAVTDLNDNGTPDLLVFFITNSPGENYGYYRIGWDLGATGFASNGWSVESNVPGWFGAEDDGAGVAVADIDGDGIKDYLVFFITDNPGENTGHYRIGSAKGQTWD